MVRILHIHTLPIISGSGINTFLTMRGMDRRLYEVELACAPGGPLIDLVETHGMKARLFPSLVQPLHPPKDLLALMNLVSLLKKTPFHIVHTHNSKAGFIGRLAARLAGVPVIVHTVHGFAFHDQEPFWRQGLFRGLERLASRWCDRMIFISQPLIDWALKEGICGRDKMVRIYSGIELDRFRPVTANENLKLREKWQIGPEDVVIGIVSKLWEGKGHVTLIEAFKEIKREIKEARLVIVGGGYLYDRLVSLVHRSGLDDSVLFTGFQTDVSEIIGTFDVAVLPSFFEGMGRVLLEAMAMEKPVVASRGGGIPDLGEHGVNGLLVRPGEVGELREAILKILKDGILAAKMAKKGREKITGQFSADMMVQSIDRVYRELMLAKGIRFDS
ncbi:MAG: glycosyltransferase family 4 protein [Pseudomonadota bacterium]